jgi:hypothetical protein
MYLFNITKYIYVTVHSLACSDTFPFKLTEHNPQNSISDTLLYEFDLTLEILEEDGSGSPVPVPQDKVRIL